MRLRFVSLGLVTLALTTCAGHGSADIHGAWLEQEGRALRLFVMTCNATLTATVTESTDEVEILVIARNRTTNDCADLLVVGLDAPLGERTVIDRHDSKPVEVLPEGSPPNFSDGTPSRNR